MGKKRSAAVDTWEDVPLDLALRIGMPAAIARRETLPEAVRRVDGPIAPSRPARPTLMIGANEPVPAAVPPRQPEPAIGASGRGGMVGLEEVLAGPPAPPAAPVAVVNRVVDGPADPSGLAPLAATPREAPAKGEMDLVVTPLLTPDDWHHFELALRRLPGVGPLRTEYYRAGILKLRVRWSGASRFAQALAGVPGYRVGILGEDRSTVQIRVARA